MAFLVKAFVGFNKYYSTLSSDRGLFLLKIAQVRVYLNYAFKSPKKNIEQIVDKYKKVFPAMKVMVDFIDNIDR